MEATFRRPRILTPLCSSKRRAKSMPLQNDPTDATWTVMGCCIIFTMQLGFAMLESGCIGHQSNHQSATLLKVSLATLTRHF